MARMLKTEVAAPNGTATNPAYTFESDGSTGMYLSAAGIVALTADEVANLFVAPDGVYTYGLLTADEDVVANGDVTHGGTGGTSMMDLEVLNWMG